MERQQMGQEGSGRSIPDRASGRLSIEVDGRRLVYDESDIAAVSFVRD